MISTYAVDKLLKYMVSSLPVCLSVSMSKEMKYVKYRERFFDIVGNKNSMISNRENKLCTIVIQAEQPTINE